jgi:hypothetical protein
MTLVSNGSAPEASPPGALAYAKKLLVGKQVDTAHNMDILAGNVVRPVGGDEGDHIGNLGRFAKLAQGDSGFQFLDCGAGLGSLSGGYHAEADGIGSDAFPGTFESGCLGDGDDAGLGRIRP